MDNERDTNALSIPAQEKLETGFSSAFQLVDDVVLKNYITRLPEFTVKPLDESAIKIIFRGYDYFGLLRWYMPKMSLLLTSLRVYLMQLPQHKVRFYYH